MDSIANYFKTVLYVIVNVFNFYGKSSRKEFWCYFSFMFTLAFYIGMMSGITGYENEFALFIFDLLVDFSFLALVVRRLRDCNMVVWLGAAAFLPYVAFPSIIIIGCISPVKYDYSIQ